MKPVTDHVRPTSILMYVSEPFLLPPIERKMIILPTGGYNTINQVILRKLVSSLRVKYSLPRFSKFFIQYIHDAHVRERILLLNQTVEPKFWRMQGQGKAMDARQFGAQVDKFGLYDITEYFYEGSYSVGDNDIAVFSDRYVNRRKQAALAAFACVVRHYYTLRKSPRESSLPSKTRLSLQGVKDILDVVEKVVGIYKLLAGGA